MIFSETAQIQLLLTPNIVGDFPKSIGKVAKLANGVTYFPGLQQITDPSSAGVTSLQGLNSQIGNKAITDSQGRLLLMNPAPGTGRRPWSAMD